MTYRRPFRNAKAVTAVGCAALLMVGRPSWSQPVDPIGDLLDKPPPSAVPSAEVPPLSEPTSTDATPPEIVTTAPEVAPTPVPTVSQPLPEPAPTSIMAPPPTPAPPSPAPSPPLPTAIRPPPMPVSRVPQTAGRRVMIDELGKTPDRPLSESDRNYEARLHAAFQTAAGAQGPLNGRWFVRSGGQTAYILQLVDKGQGVVEGAWRDPNRLGALGFIEAVQRTGDQLNITLRSRPRAEIVTLNLRIDALGQANGELVDQGQRRQITMSRQ